MTNCPCDEPPDVERDIARALNSIAAGQSALPRQVRSFPEVREALLASLPRPENEALQLWRARNSRDLGLMLLEMWAYVSDVLAFYDERIANESYLRTAQRPISLRRLVELLGYIPAPGIAGSVTLAALAEGRKAVQLPAGTAFRSDAFGDQPPQVFEITTPTVIHPFKNEWTIGPLQKGTLPQLAPSQVEAQQRGTSPTKGEFLVFETLEFGLAVDRQVLVTAPYFPSQPSTVKAIRPFAAKDGRTYAEVQFTPPINLEDVFVTIDANLVKVLVPTVSFPSPARVTAYQALVREGQNETTTFKPVDAAQPSGPTAIAIYLDSVYRQLRVGDSIIVLTPSGAQHGTADAVKEEFVEIQPAPGGSSPVPATRVPVTFVRIAGVQYPSFPRAEDFSFHFSFVDGGRVTTVAETELTPQQLANSFLPVQGIVDRPPDATSSGSLDQKFLLTDPDSNGAEVDGRMLFGASGRAQFDILANLAAVPSPLPADRYKTPLTVYGNVITATRGESVFNEVLGSGDPRIPGQQFTLKKKPLTYVSAPNALGRTSTLQLFCCPPSQVLGRGRPARLRSLPNPCSAASGLRADGRDVGRCGQSKRWIGAGPTGGRGRGTDFPWLRLRVGAAASSGTSPTRPLESGVALSVAARSTAREGAAAVQVCPNSVGELGARAAGPVRTSLADAGAVLSAIRKPIALLETRGVGCNALSSHATTLIGTCVIEVFGSANVPAGSTVPWIRLGVAAGACFSGGACPTGFRAAGSTRAGSPVSADRTCGTRCARATAAVRAACTRSVRASVSSLSSAPRSRTAVAGGRTARPGAAFACGSTFAPRETTLRNPCNARVAGRASTGSRTARSPARAPRARDTHIRQAGQTGIARPAVARTALGADFAALIVIFATFRASPGRYKGKQTTQSGIARFHSHRLHCHERFHGKPRSATCEPVSFGRLVLRDSYVEVTP